LTTNWVIDWQRIEWPFQNFDLVARRSNGARSGLTNQSIKKSESLGWSWIKKRLMPIDSESSN
jgi:hypothetical protein